MTIRTALVAASAAALMAISACAAPAGVEGTSTPTVAPEAAQGEMTAQQATVEPQPEPQPEPAPAPSGDDLAERAYLSTVGDKTYPSTDDALMVGWATCALLATGSTVEDLGMEVMTARGTIVPGFVNDELPYFYGAAIGALCPEYRYQLDGY